MTEAELYSAFQSAVALNTEICFGYIGVMTAFLVMSYMVGHKLPTVLTAIVVALFSLVSILITTRIMFNRNDAEALMAHMLQQKELGNFDLAWLGTNPSWGTQTATILDIVVLLGGFLACLGFFFYRRKTAKHAA